MATKRCPYCKEVLIRRPGETPSQLKRRKYCSRDHGYKNISKKARITRKCKHCGVKFEITKAQVATGYFLFHDRECWKDWLAKQKDERMLTLTCVGCGIIFKREEWRVIDPDRTYCTVTCSNEHPEARTIRRQRLKRLSKAQVLKIRQYYCRISSCRLTARHFKISRSAVEDLTKDLRANGIPKEMQEASNGFVARVFTKLPPSKIEHRIVVREFLTREGPLRRLLTLTGPTLDFEKSLVFQDCKQIIGVEQNEILYSRAVSFLDPVEQSGEELTDKVFPCVKNGKIRVLNASLLDLISVPEEHPIFPWINATYLHWDAVWLDFCGHLTHSMIELLPDIAGYSTVGARIAITIMASRDKGYSNDEQRIAVVREAMNLTDEGTHRYVSEKRAPMLTVFGIAQ